MTPGASTQKLQHFIGWMWNLISSSQITIRELLFRIVPFLELTAPSLCITLASDAQPLTRTPAHFLDQGKLKGAATGAEFR
jgi:hypothetical protein